jgi:homopolymeric O-antigen transport system permease protein
MNPDRTSDAPGPPAAAWAILPDTLFAVAAYVLAYRLRFVDERFYAFLTTALRALPLTVACQLAALLAARIYRPGGRYRFVSRLLVSVVAGTLTGASLTRLLLGFEGVSRIAFLVDATFLAAAALTWRGLYLLWHYGRSGHAKLSEEAPLVDRSQETISLSATFLSMLHYRELLKNLVLKDLKLKYRGSVFGFLWSLVNPLVMITVYTLAFTFILRVRSEGFAFFVLIGVLAWTFFAQATMMSSGAIIDNAGLIKSLYFPRAILPISVVLFNLAQYVLTLIVFLPLMLIIYRVPLSPNMLLFPLFLGLQVAFTIGLAFILSTATAFFRDVRHLIEVALLVLFWTTPILYELRLVPETLRLPIMMSPMSPYIVAYQQLFFYRQLPDATVWFLAMAYALAALIAGAATFVAMQDRLAEQI